MVDDAPEPTTPLPDAGRARREGPTIDLQATEIPGDTGRDGERETGNAAGDPTVEPARPEPPAPVSPWVAAFVSGLVAASLVIGVGWILGWPPVTSTPPAPQVSAATVDGLAARVAGVESKISKPPAVVPDPAAATRIDALEKSLAALRSDLVGLRAQTEKLAGNLGSIKTAPGETPPLPDLGAINDRIAQLERAISAEGAAIAQQGAKSADTKPADDLPLRRVVAASLLEISVRHGDPFVATLAAAKSLSANPDALKPLDGFAAKGVPSAAILSRELLTLIPKLSPPMPDNAAGNPGIVERLKAGALKLVPIERTDAVGNDRGAVVARATAAALRNDFAEARRELKTLPPADRTAAQEWLDKADARDAALTVSRRFADDAMADLARPGQ
jgi:hypothetical protein